MTLGINVLGPEREKYKFSETFDRLKKYFFKKKLETIQILGFWLNLSHFFSEILKNLTTGFQYLLETKFACKIKTHRSQRLLGRFWQVLQYLKVDLFLFFRIICETTVDHVRQHPTIWDNTRLIPIAQLYDTSPVHHRVIMPTQNWSTFPSCFCRKSTK